LKDLDSFISKKRNQVDKIIFNLKNLIITTDK
jgi:hypothetical protein